MGGKRVYGYREGDRSEYLAQFLLSRFSFVYPFPRQEDFGVADFLCVLGQQTRKVVYPEGGYYVQVKSNENDIIFDKDTSNWISHHMDLPLLICVIDKKQSRMKLYSTSKIWVGLFMKHKPISLTLQMNEGTDDERIFRPTPDELVIPIGLPILSKDYDEIEKSPDRCAEILRPWLLLDKLNIARRSIGRVYCSSFLDWAPNSEPKKIFNQYTIGPEYEVVEKDLAQILTALAHNYRNSKDAPGLDALVQLMKKFPQYMDKHGLGFINGDLVIEE